MQHDARRSAAARQSHEQHLVAELHALAKEVARLRIENAALRDESPPRRGGLRRALLNAAIGAALGACLALALSWLGWG